MATPDNKGEKKTKGIQRDTIIDQLLKKLNEIDFKCLSKIANIDFAMEIERGCFAKTISKCKQSPEAYIRNWSSQIFVNFILHVAQL